MYKMKQNAILICKVDEEDGWVSGGLAFRVQNIDDHFEELKDKLSSQNIIDYLVEEHCLLEDLFDGDETFRFHKVGYNDYGYLTYEFKNDEGDIEEIEFQTERIYIP